MDLASVFTQILNAVSLALPGLFQDGQEKPRTYDGAQVWRTTLHSKKDFNRFQEFAKQEDISLWKLSRKIVDYLVTEENIQRIHTELRRKELDHRVLITDVQRKIDATKVKPAPWTDTALRKGHRLNFHSYPDNQVIDEYIEYVKVHYASIARVSEIGRSVENRTIKMIRISNGNPRNKVMLIVGGEHAREWIAITSTLYIANNIITKFDEQPNYMKNKDWYIIPLLNPDGYHYTQKVDRLWRKNRRVNSDPICPGVDLNRNFPHNWNVEYVTTHQLCKEDYAGTHSLSEPEARALVISQTDGMLFVDCCVEAAQWTAISVVYSYTGVLNTMENKVPSAYLDLHSYGQYILYPWAAFKTPASPHVKVLSSTADVIKQAISKLTGRNYTSGTAPDLLYAASGSAIDFFHSKGVPLTYAFEGRDTSQGEHGFLLPPYQIESSGKEMLAAARVIAKAIDTLRKGATGSKKKEEWF